ncbi:MAG: hypothetical protein LBI13_05610 [Streptococcaceae bacterium]|jgi:arginyl-tRNA--protein-N-Asp/Glu arginylyltransferase|nr:hypothetical protein [Streptococcaceae bacterium]
MSVDKFELYKIYLESIEKISDRRDNANKYFLQVQSAILVLAGLIIQFGGHEKKLLIGGLTLFGLIISIIFWFLINSYKQMNSGKFKVLHEMEQELEIDMYQREWLYLGEGKDKKKYFPFSHVERLVPIVFGVAYIVIFVLLFFR